MRHMTEDTQAIIVDYQEKLMPVMYEKEQLEKNSVILIKGLKALGVPMTLTQQYTKGIGMTIPSIFEAAETEEFMDKTTFSCYDDETIKARVDGFGKKTVIVCGIEAHICVLQTCMDLKASGYEPVLVVDCISSRKASDKEIAVKRAIHEGITVTTYEAILFELTKKAGSDTFKTISKLIK